MTYRRSTLHVFTYKEGLLSRVAHDLCIALTRFELRVSQETIHAEFELESLEPLGAMVRSTLDTSVLTSKDLAEIKKTIQTEVLATARYPRATLTGVHVNRGDMFEVSGELELHGRRRPLSFVARREGGKLYGEVELRPSDFGIAPYKAMLGTLRLQDRVLVRLELDEAEVTAA